MTYWHRSVAENESFWNKTVDSLQIIIASALWLSNIHNEYYSSTGNDAHCMQMYAIILNKHPVIIIMFILYIMFLMFIYNADPVFHQIWFIIIIAMIKMTMKMIYTILSVCE